MGRSTFEGPILSGDQRFGPQRDVGSVLLTQNCLLDFSKTTAGSAGYGGASTQYATSNNIPNQLATIYTAQSGAYSSSGPTTAATQPTADASGTTYRGAVFLLPQGSYLKSVELDLVVNPTDGSNAASATLAFISNGFVTSAAGSTYASIASTGTTVGRYSATFSATQYANAVSTLQDVQNMQPGQQPTWFSQVVVNLQILSSALTTPNAGKYNIIVSYIQPDTNIGNSKTYPYGNFD